jgi:H/ACA ribonucleoprotein complex subunit 3
MNKIKYCQKCDKYTFNAVCSVCGEKTITKVPPKYSPQDRMAVYRRIAKKEILKEKGLL